jgi:hypothetical protein
MLLRFQKAGVRGNSETGNQAFSMHLRFLTIRDGEKLAYEIKPFRPLIYAREVAERGIYYSSV